MAERMPEDYRRFLQPEVISKLSNLELKARLVVEGFITGLHRSPYHGFSVEFAEHRQYMPGDPIRNIDWKLFAKSDRYFVKEFEEETNLKAYILLDASASMGYTSSKISKLEYSRYLAASLTYLMLKQRDSVGLLVFDEGIRRYIPPKAARSHLNIILKELDSAEASEKTDVGGAFHELAERIKRRGLIIVISDLFDEPDRLLVGLKHFRHKKHEVIVFHVLDPYEKDFSYSREAKFIDMETGEEILTNPWQVRGSYKERLGDFITDFRRECREAMIDYFPIDTSVSFDKALFAYLGKRAKLG